MFVMALVALVAMVALGCGTSNPQAEQQRSSTTAGSPQPRGDGAAGPANASAGTSAFPGKDWQTVDPAAAGMDIDKLEEIARRAEAAHSNCLVVIRDGKLVKEWYWNGNGPESAQEVFSATKSYTSALVGIAQDEGKLSIDDKATKYIPQWNGTPSQDVTVRNLLSNNSGRHYDAVTDYVKMATQENDKTAFAISLGQDAPPGTVWEYNNSAIQTLSAVLKQATGEEASSYADKKLLDPIGMERSEMRKDPSGNTLTFMGLSSTCRDMARFGHLFLNKGNWDGKQILPASYVEDAVGHSSQELNASYGYLWWLNRRGKVASDEQATTGGTTGRREGQMVPGAPEDMFWALGLGNQIISVDPGSRTVVVRIGPVNVPPGSGRFTQKDAADVVTTAVSDR